MIDDDHGLDHHHDKSNDNHDHNDGYYADIDAGNDADTDESPSVSAPPS